MHGPLIHPLYDERTHTFSYVVADPDTKSCAIIDAVLDFDSAQGKLWTESLDRIMRLIKKEGYTPQWILETHVHADHLSGGGYLRKHWKIPLGIGARVTEVQQTFIPIFGTKNTKNAFDHLFQDGETLQIGNLTARILHTPGHTPADISYLIGDAIFVGDTMFQPDIGVARTDFPGGSARDPYASVQKLYTLPEQTRVFVGHDYPAPPRITPQAETSIGAQKSGNVEIHSGIDADAFVRAKTQDDATLNMPNLIIPSIQVNIRGGQVPSELRIPINSLFTKTSA